MSTRPNHPDQREAADDYLKSQSPYSLDEIIDALNGGTVTDFNSAEAKSAQEQLRNAALGLLSAIDERQPQHGGMGHNGPPVDDHGNILPEGFENELQSSAVVIAQQMGQDVPDPLAVAKATDKLAQLRLWLLPKLDNMADEFFKSFGKHAGTAVAGIVGVYVLDTIFPGIGSTLHAALSWLRSIF